MSYIKKLCCWLFPFRDEAERKSTHAINGLEMLIDEMRRDRKEARIHHHEKVQCDECKEEESNVIRATD